MCDTHMHLCAAPFLFDPSGFDLKTFVAAVLMYIETELHTVPSFSVYLQPKEYHEFPNFQ